MFDLAAFIRQVFAPEPGESVTVMTDVPHGAYSDDDAWVERRQMAEEWRQAFARLGAEIGFAVRPLVQYRATGAHSAPLPPEALMGVQSIGLEEVLLDSTLVVAFGQFSATAPLLLLTQRKPDLRAVSLPLVQRRMEATALSADYGEVQRRVRALVPLLSSACGAALIFDTGHSVFFDLRYREALADDGYFHRDRQPPRAGNLPAGEAYIAPYEGEREDKPSRTYGALPVMYAGEQVVFTVVRNRITHVAGDGPAAARMRAYFAEDDARSNIAELGLGVNPAAVVWGNVLEDEKAGIHWAYGRNDMFGGTVGVSRFKSPDTVVHQDIVYAPASPIQATVLTLHFPDGSSRVIYERGWTIF